MKCNLSFAGALADLVMRCKNDLSDIEDARTRMKGRLNQAAAVYGIDPGAVRRLLKWLEEQRRAGADAARTAARRMELDDAYRALLSGGDKPTVSKRADTELDKVMALATDNKPPKIDDIMGAVGCSRGKAHKLRTLAAVRLAAKSSSSSVSGEHEQSNETPQAVALAPAGETEVLAAIGRPELGLTQ